MPRAIWIGLLAALLIGGGPIFGQPASPELHQFQARTKEFGGALQSTLQPDASSPLQRENVVDFVIGNMLFVLLHETAHNIVTEFSLPILGRQEDAADEFAVLTLLKVGSPMSQRILAEAARGWFLSDRRAKKDGDNPVYYDQHGLDAQRAYHIICLMVGSDPGKFCATRKPGNAAARSPEDLSKRLQRCFIGLGRGTQTPSARRRTTEDEYRSGLWRG